MNNNKQIVNLDFSKICRICLMEGKMTNLYQNCVEDDCLVLKLLACTFVQISPNDGLPSQICSICLDILNVSYSFMQKCEKSDEILRKSLNCIIKPVSKLYNNHKIKNNTFLNDITIENKISVNSDSEHINDNNSDNLNCAVFIDHNYFKKNENIDFKEEKIDINIQDDKANVANNTSKQEAKPILKSTPTYSCKKCNVQFSVYFDLHEHFKTVQHKEKSFSVQRCTVCSKIVSHSHLKLHMKIHSKEKSFCCEYCGKKFMISSNLNRHRRIHTGEKPYSCDICKKRFTQFITLKEHKRIHTGEKPYVCSTCGKSFSHLAVIRVHSRKHERERQEILNQDTEKVKKLYICECSEVFKSLGAFKTHQQSHEEKKFFCSECQRRFTTLERLQNHQETHKGHRPFVCHICQKTFVRKCNLNAHLLIHSGEKRHSCDICKKTFTHLGQLRGHLRTHSGAKPYKCKFCDKAFALNGNLTVHMRIHTGETPYVCNLCEKGFYDSSSLKKHIKSHNSLIKD